MDRLFHSLKTEWMPSSGYNPMGEKMMDIGWFLVTHYNRRPHAANGGLPATAKKEKRNLLSGTS